MEENQKLPFAANYEMPAAPEQLRYPAGKKELWMGAVMALLGVLLCHWCLNWGFYLGFAVTSGGILLCAGIYLLRHGHRPGPYAWALLAVSLVICGAFLRSDDGFVKFVMVIFLCIGSSLGLCLQAGKNRRDPAGVLSLLDACRVMFSLGFGKMAPAFRGIAHAWKNGSTAGKKRGAVLVGLLAAVPVLAVVIPLLIASDTAFEGLLAKLPEFEWALWIPSLILGLPLACVLYTAAAALAHDSGRSGSASWSKTVNPLTVNTVLGAVGCVYVVYLLSQLAYVVGGFSGILPEDFTLADYARRGFFEMAWLCAINLGIMTLAAALSRREGSIHPVTRWLCLFIGVVTLFFTAAAAAKMALYIGSYGLTRLRVLTSVIMLFLALTTVIVSLWLFLPRLPYMKAVLLSGLILGAAVAWVDVDTVVAAYNVSAYRSGRLESVDIDHLSQLSDGAVPYIARLTEDEVPTVAAKAENVLKNWYSIEARDLRSWNIASAVALPYLEEFSSDGGVNTDFLSDSV